MKNRRNFRSFYFFPNFRKNRNSRFQNLLILKIDVRSKISRCFNIFFRNHHKFLKIPNLNTMTFVRSHQVFAEDGVERDFAQIGAVLYRTTPKWWGNQYQILCGREWCHFSADFMRGPRKSSWRFATALSKSATAAKKYLYLYN